MKQRILAVVMAVAVGFMYPDICFTEESYEAYDSHWTKIEKTADDGIDIMKMAGSNVKVKSRLLEMISEMAGEKNYDEGRTSSN